MKTQVLIILLGLCCVSARAQNCDKIVQKIEVAYRAGRLDEALTQIRALRACDVSEQGKKLADTWTEKVYKSVQAQKDLAQSSLTKANRLIRHFNFDDEKAAWAYKDGLFAVIDRNGNTLTDFMYENPEPFNNGVAIAGINNQYVFVNDRGEEVSERYDYLILTVGGYYLGRIENEQCILDNKGKVIFDKLGNFVNGYIKVRLNNRWGFIDSNISTVIPPQFDAIGDFYEGLAKAKFDNNWGFIDTSGTFIIYPLYFEPSDVVDNYARIENEIYFIDRIKKKAICCKSPEDKNTIYTFLKGFHEGLAGVGIYNFHKQDLSWGYIDSTWKITIPPIYDNVSNFEQGLAWVENNPGKWGLINKFGQYIIDLEYEDLVFFSEGYVGARKNNKWCIINPVGKIVADCIFDNIKELQKGIFGYKQGDKWGVINKEGYHTTGHFRKRWKKARLLC